MTTIVVALDEPHRGRLAASLERHGARVIALAAAEPAVTSRAGSPGGTWREGELLLVPARADTLTRELVQACDRSGIRVVPIGAGEAAARLAQSFGLIPPLTPEADAREVLSAATAPAPQVPVTASPDHPILAVWGSAGSPGRTTVAIELASHVAVDRSVALVDADTHAPAVAMLLGLADEGPGFAAACRQAQRDALDVQELERVAVPIDDKLRVLTGLNRPSRWPELSEDRVTSALQTCRGWVSATVVDVAAPLDRDEEIVSDLVGPRRNAATIAALQAADAVVAVASADPLGMARFLRGYAQLRETIGTTPVHVVVNRLRPGPLGMDARGQIRRTLDRFAGVREVWFVPNDPRAADAALLAGRAIREVAPRSAFSQAVRRLADDLMPPLTGAASSRHRMRARLRAIA